MLDKEEKISVPAYGGGGLQVQGLQSQEVDRLRASLLGGHHWVRGDGEGRLEHVPSFEPLPGPVTDEEMLPYWRKPRPEETRQAEMFGFDKQTEAELLGHLPSIYITGLCGYSHTPENYKRQAEKLSSWGFICMRSQRYPDDGQFFEVWYLPGLYSVKGTLAESISRQGTSTDVDKLKWAIHFLCCNASFGNLEVSVQRVALVID